MRPPIPVPSPTASPVQASPNPHLVEFEERLDEASSRLGQLVRSFGAAASPPGREEGQSAAQSPSAGNAALQQAAAPAREARAACR